jgi:hypothetical protein
MEQAEPVACGATYTLRMRDEDRFHQWVVMACNKPGGHRGSHYGLPVASEWPRERFPEVG